MRKLRKALKAIGRFINRAIMDLAADRPGGGMATTQKRIGGQDWENDLPSAPAADRYGVTVHRHDHART